MVAVSSFWQTSPDADDATIFHPNKMWNITTLHGREGISASYRCNHNSTGPALCNPIPEHKVHEMWHSLRGSMLILCDNLWHLPRFLCHRLCINNKFRFTTPLTFADLLHPLGIQFVLEIFGAAVPQIIWQTKTTTGFVLGPTYVVFTLKTFDLCAIKCGLYWRSFRQIRN